MSFWQSSLGEVTGKPEDAFAQTFRKIPDNTMAKAKIVKFSKEEFGQNKFFKIDWLLVDGEFKGQHVFQKIHAFDADDKKRHKALNMMRLLYDLFKLAPKHSLEPTDADLMVFSDKLAGIKIQETEPNDEGKTYNWVSEIHPVEGFQCETGHTVVTTHKVDSALSRHVHMKAVVEPGIEDDLPF